MGRLPEPDFEYLTIAESAGILGCHSNTIRNLIKKGVFEQTFFPDDRRAYIHRTSVLKYKDCSPSRYRGSALLELSERVRRLEEKIDLLVHRYPVSETQIELAKHHKSISRDVCPYPQGGHD